MTLKRQIKKVMDLWRISTIRFTYMEHSNRWLVEGKCISNDWPVTGWRAGEWYHLAPKSYLTTTTLEGALDVAGEGAKRLRSIES